MQMSEGKGRREGPGASGGRPFGSPGEGTEVIHRVNPSTGLSFCGMSPSGLSGPNREHPQNDSCDPFGSMIRGVTGFVQNLRHEG
jgi:hypothetical protein